MDDATATKEATFTEEQKQAARNALAGIAQMYHSAVCAWSRPTHSTDAGPKSPPAKLLMHQLFFAVTGQGLYDDEELFRLAGLCRDIAGIGNPTASTVQDAARDAVLIQDACNAGGVSNSLRKHMERIGHALNDDILKLILHQLGYLAGLDYDDVMGMDEWTAAHKRCKGIAGDGD